MVAREAGVSPSTVSRILNGTAQVSHAKTSAVEQAIARLNFQPNPVARGLARGRTHTIGVITQAIDSPFYGEGLRGIEDCLEKVGYTPLFVSGHWRQADEQACFKQLQARRVDGIIVLTGCLPDSFLTAAARHLPLVLTGRTLTGDSLYSINFDNYEGARLATRHLIDLGHDKIAFIAGPTDRADAAERLRGYRAALGEAGFTFDPELVVKGDYREIQGSMAVRQLIDLRVNFTSIFAANDQTAYGATLELHRKGLRVPDDISVVGFDDLRNSSYCIPPLTTIHHGIYEIGQAAAMAIIDLIEGRTPSQCALPPELIIRESSKRIRN